MNPFNSDNSQSSLIFPIFITELNYVLNIPQPCTYKCLRWQYHYIFSWNKKALLVQVVERVWDAHDDFHTSLGGQLLDGCISFLPKRLRIILNGKSSNAPFLKQDKRSNDTSQLYSYALLVTVNKKFKIHTKPLYISQMSNMKKSIQFINVKICRWHIYTNWISGLCLAWANLAIYLRVLFILKCLGSVLF